MLEHADLEGVDRDGHVRVALSLPPSLFAVLAEWEADAPEDDEIDDAAPEQRFYGSGNAG